MLKEFLQLRRDRITFAMIVGFPLIQLGLFGFAINTDPKQMPTAVINNDPSEFSRSFIAAMKASNYFAIAGQPVNEKAAQALLAQGKVLFVVNIPSDFSVRLVRGERPALLVEADASDPSATGTALAAMEKLAQSVMRKDLVGALARLSGHQSAFEVRVHRRYNPEGITQYNIIPGLMGVILTMTMVMMTGLSITRERERGTMENLLATPVRPIEVMTGKIIPYIMIGMIQSTLILLAARFVFHVPFMGSLSAIYLSALLFVAANLTVGITLSSLAQNQLQALQLTMFYFMPNMLLTGFMFPFQGMPQWARFVGSALPLTYFNRLIRGILLKGNSWPDLWPNVWPLMMFTVVVMGVALKFYRKTLD